MKLAELLSIAGPTPIRQLSKEQLKEMQRALSLLGYPVGKIDGLIGPKTRSAWSEFKIDVYSGNSEFIGKQSVVALQEKLDGVLESNDHDFSSKEGTKEAIKSACRAMDIGLNSQIAYVLATTQWETNQTFKPVREAYWLDEDWRKNNFPYYPFYGRGYVQLTWKNNYEQYSSMLDLDMVNEPDIAMRPNVALFVLVHGFKTGTFTGRKITDYLDETKTDFIGARRCINGNDKAHEIAELAKKFLVHL